MTNPLITVLIPARNEEKFLPQCIESIRASASNLPPGTVEILVILNRCTDRTEQIAEALGCRTTQESAKNLSVIRNRGIQEAHGEILITIDADSRMSPTLIPQVIREMHSGKSIGGGVFIIPERWSFGIFFTGLLVLIILAIHRISVGVFFGKREDFLAIGGFDENLTSVEDIDFAKRLKDYGRRKGKRYSHLFRSYIITSCRKFDTFGDWYFLKNIGLTRRLLKGRSPQDADKVWYDFPH